MDNQDMSMTTPLTLGEEKTLDSSVRWPVHIEVRISVSCNSRFDTIRELMQQHIYSDTHLILSSEITGWESNKTLADNVERVTVSECSCPIDVLPMSQAELMIHVYQPSEDVATEETTGLGGDAPGEEATAAFVCDLPSQAFEGLWDSLIYPDDIKTRLLDYIYATLVFSDADVDFNIVSWNRVVLLHGPPGTGKTSLCRALAQKLSIRLSSRYSHARLLEINSHSLFSRWFSESGKLVQKLFGSVHDMCEEEDCFVVVLIDEVESLTVARAGAVAGTEPSDALRVVNALLTQLDRLRYKKNVLVMSTSNLVKAIDSAFVDRADIVQYVGLPTREAIYEILRTCLLELIKKGIVTPLDVPTIAQADIFSKTAQDIDSDEPPITNNRERSNMAGLKLLRLSERCRGMSGRALRRLPVLAHASYIGLPIRPVMSQSESPVPVVSTTSNGKSRKRYMSRGGGEMRRIVGPKTDVELWLSAMEKVIDKQIGDRSQVEAF